MPEADRTSRTGADEFGTARFGDGIDKRRINLVRLAEAQTKVRVLIICQLLLFMFGVLALGVISPGSPKLYGIVLNVVCLLWVSLTGAMMVFASRMATAYGFHWAEGMAVGLLPLIPCLGLILTIIVSGHVSRVLERAGARVGLLGVSSSEMRKLRIGICRGCGYDLRGLPSSTCPECGSTIRV